MQIQELQPVHKLGWIPAYDWWADHQVNHASGFSAPANWVETVPVLPQTVLGLELLLQDRSLPLQMASDLILRDVGATLQIMRLISIEVPAMDARPFRITDCLAMLDTATWFSALCGNTVSASMAQTEITPLWKHCRGVAHFAKLIAASVGDISPEDAYLAGLLHEVENMGPTLDKHASGNPTEGVRLNQILFPSIMTALQSATQRGSGSIWRYVLASAHALATTPPAGSSRPISDSKPFVV